MRPAAILALALAACWLAVGALRPRTDGPGPIRAASAEGAPAGATATAPPGWTGELRLPFDAAEGWRYTGGPHAAWMPPDHSDPVALDFAPPSNWTGAGSACDPAPEWARAIMPGEVTRADDGRLWLVGPDGWEALYLHLSDMPAPGTTMAAGDPVGHPACEGSNLRSGGAHVHLAVMRGGEWTIPVLDGWTFTAAGGEYAGVATRGGERRCSIQVAARDQGCETIMPAGPARRDDDGD